MAKLVLARIGRALQKMELPDWTRRRKLKMLESPSKVSLLITVLLITVSFEILFLSSFIIKIK